MQPHTALDFSVPRRAVHLNIFWSSFSVLSFLGYFLEYISSFSMEFVFGQRHSAFLNTIFFVLWTSFLRSPGCFRHQVLSAVAWEKAR